MPLPGLELSSLALYAFVITQVLYSLTFVLDLYIFSLPVNRADDDSIEPVAEIDLPPIVLFMPVLDELEETLRTTLTAVARCDYPRDRLEVIAVPNANDDETIANLRRLEGEFSFLQVMCVPGTDDPSWQPVWKAWDANPKAYWWREGKRAGNRNLPPKKTRQLIYAYYTRVAARPENFLVNYIDADSCPPPDHFLKGAAGMQRFDVIQAENIAGNLNDSLAASWHSFDHMVWDGRKYAHLTADGRQPFWVLGKGLFFRSEDLAELGGFHPWLAIEDPEVGLRFWKNGKRLGVLKNPLIEEVPVTFGRGITQRKRWVCGFFQTLSKPLDRLGFTPMEKFRAWLNFLPCLSLWINAPGVPIGLWAVWMLYRGADVLPLWASVLAVVNLVAFAVSLSLIYIHTWRRTALVLPKLSSRLWYMLSINPISVLIWWLVWLIPLAIGYWMFLRDEGLVWERTEKINANQALIESGRQGAGLAST